LTTPAEKSQRKNGEATFFRKFEAKQRTVALGKTCCNAEEFLDDDTGFTERNYPLWHRRLPKKRCFACFFLTFPQPV